MDNHHKISKKEYFVLGAFFCVLVFSASFVFLESKEKKSESSEGGETVVENHIDWERAFENVSLSARSAIVYDINSGKVLFGLNEDEQYPLASQTKVMTAIVAYDHLDPSAIITIDEEAISLVGAARLRPYERWNFRNLLDYTLLVSSNEGAVAIASAAGATINMNLRNADREKTAREIFIEEMNQRAKNLGLKKTYFTNESGLDDRDGVFSGGYASAADMAILYSYALREYPELFEVTSKNVVGLSSLDNIPRQAQNTNTLTQSIPGTILSKTGFTDLAGGNLTVVFNAGPMRPIVISVLASTREGRFEDVKSLYLATIKQFSIE